MASEDDELSTQQATALKNCGERNLGNPTDSQCDFVFLLSELPSTLLLLTNDEPLKFLLYSFLFVHTYGQ